MKRYRNLEPSRLLDKAKGLYQSKAEKIVRSKEQLENLIHKVSDKLQAVSENPTVQEVKLYISVIIRMIKAYCNNEYRSFSSKTLALLVLGLLYFVMPLDLIPDFIVGLGYLDDLSVLLAITKSIQHDIQNFLDWERTKI
ncbi:YkvA family protein [Echinicola shivajiensis]|uniref:YkvA family protein n=1 Tax=Echinicola shivajiensis TaxID=1035916 RepID=UPI001BFC7DEE|nr:YkvA family protein [Echinicola shivajiensis]